MHPPHQRASSPRAAAAAPRTASPAPPPPAIGTRGRRTLPLRSVARDALDSHMMGGPFVETALDEHESVPPPPRAVPASPPHVQEPAHEHEPRSGLRRRPAPEAPLPALSRGEGEGRARPHHVRGVVEHRPGLAVGVRPDLDRRRLDRPRAPRVLRARAPARVRDHVPDHPHGAPHALGRRGLAAPDRAVAGARARPPLVPQGDGPARHPAGGAGLRRRRAPLPRRRARRRRAPRLRASHPPVLDAAGQPADRRVRRKPREPGPLRPRGPGGGARAGGRRLPRRLPDDGGRAQGRRARPGGLPRPREALRGHRNVRLPERGRWPGGRRARALGLHPEHGGAAGAPTCTSRRG